MHRLVGEDRGRPRRRAGAVEGVRRRAARARPARPARASSTAGAATSIRSSSTCSARRTAACSRPCASRSRGRASACASRRRSAARSAAASARPAGSASCATSRPGRSSSRCSAVRRESPERPTTGVVFQGQGEPLQNYDNVMQAARVLRDPCGPRIGARPHHDLDRGPAAADRALHRGAPAVPADPLAHARPSRRSARGSSRSRPATASRSSRRDAPARRRARRPGPASRWVLISGYNSGAEEARELARLFAGVRVRVSVIDVNDPRAASPRASDDERGRFLPALSDNGLGFVRRYSGGPDIDAACGMLASRRARRRRARAPRTGAMSARVLPGDRSPGARRRRRDAAARRARRLPHRDRLRARRQRLRRPRGRAHLRGEGAAVLRSADRPPGRGGLARLGGGRRRPARHRSWPSASGRDR